MKHEMRRQLVHVLVLTSLSSSGVGWAQKDDLLRGSLDNPAGSDECNPCVESVIQAVHSLRNHGATLGFNWGGGYPELSGAGTKSHWQGVQRLQIRGNGFPYLVVSSSHRNPVGTIGQPDANIAHFAVVEMASRLHNVGRRLRSNRLEPGVLTRFVPPNTIDRIVMANPVTPEFDHPGGIQSVGKYLLVGADGNVGHERDVAQFSLWDMMVPSAPRSVWTQPNWELPIQNANSVGIIRLQDGRYLMARALSDAKNLEFYLLIDNLEDNPADYHDGQPWDVWNYRELQSELYNADSTLDRKWADLGNILGDVGYQSTNLVTECGSGEIYLIASHGRRPGGIGGDDFVDAYRVDIPAQRPDAGVPGEGIVITKVAKRHMFPSGNSKARQGDLQAAGGAYVSPDNKLYYYATEHGRTGDGGYVKMIEFAPAESFPNVRFVEDAWVELYDRKNFDGRSIILDYVDQPLRDYDNFGRIEEFDNLASSAIYSIPAGHRLRLFAERGGAGGFVDLVGDGTLHRITEFGSLNLTTGESADNQFSSAAWLANVTTAETEGIGNNTQPSSFELHQNYPNPFNPATFIDYRVRTEAHIRIAIYDIKGQLIKVLAEQRHVAGFYSVIWDGSDTDGNRVASGTYLYRLEVDEFVQTRKLTLLR